MLSNPLITVLIASYNRLSYLKKSINSAINQDFNDFEILIIDDGSDIDTKNFLKNTDAMHKNLRVIFQENTGVACARQRGIENSWGKYVCILDSDDILINSSLRILANNIKLRPDIDLFYCNNIEIYPNGQSKISCYKQFNSNKEFSRAIFTYPRVPFKHSGTTFKLRRALEINGYDKDLLMKIDIDFILKSLRSGFKCHFIEEPLINFYFHSNSISRKKRFRGILVWFKIIDKYVENWASKLYFKFVKSLFELLKFFYEKYKLPKYKQAT